MSTSERIEYFKSLGETEDGTIVKWFIHNAKKQGVSDAEIVRELQLRNNMVASSNGYSVLVNN